MASDLKLAVYEAKAREAADRLERAASIGRQLSLIATEASPADVAELERRGPGRPVGARNKRTSKLRAMLAARGFRMPEDVLAEIAGLSSRETSIELALARAEQVLGWAFGTAEPSGGQRPAGFLAGFKEQTSAASAMLPYGLEKMTPDAAPAAAVTLVLPNGGAPGDDARVIEGAAMSDLAPPPMPGEIKRNQSVSERDPDQSDDGSRTE